MRAFVKPDLAADRIDPAEMDVPQVGADELLVRMHAVGWAW